MLEQRADVESSKHFVKLVLFLPHVCFFLLQAARGFQLSVAVAILEIQTFRIADASSWCVA